MPLLQSEGCIVVSPVKSAGKGVPDIGNGAGKGLEVEEREGNLGRL